MSFTIATTLEEALAAVAEGARPIAGGTDLVVGARHGKAPLPENLVASDRVEDMDQVELNGDGTRIGALLSHADLMTDPLIVESYSAIADASALVGSPSTRHLGTIGGNVMNGSPAMDTGAPLLVLGARAELVRRTESSKAGRFVPLTQLWVGPGQTSAAADELLVALHLPAPQERCGSAYVRLEYRRAMEIAVVGAAAGVTLAEDGTIASAAVALAAVAPTILAVDGANDAEPIHLAGEVDAILRHHLNTRVDKGTRAEGSWSGSWELSIRGKSYLVQVWRVRHELVVAREEYRQCVALAVLRADEVGPVRSAVL